MSMSISSVTSTAGSAIEKGTGILPEKAVNNEVENIKSVETLEKAERAGTKVSIGDEQIVRNIERALKAIQGAETTFEMAMHEETQAIVIKVRNKETGELIREIPPEKTLDLVARLMEINGILIDEKV